MKTVSVVLCLASCIAKASSGQLRCAIEPCLVKFSLVGSDRQFCNATEDAHVCMQTLLDGPLCHGPVKKYARDLEYRLKRISLCICSSGDSVMSSLVLFLGLGCVARFMTHFK